MKFVKLKVVFDRGFTSQTPEWPRIMQDIQNAIGAIEWPKGSGSFTIYAESGKKRGQGNGVKPIKDACVLKLQSFGWEPEKRLPFITAINPGPIDATFFIHSKSQYFALEWETGNISSSHRAINKMALGILKGHLAGGILIVPTRDLYQYLTDRVGNYRELMPYWRIWKALKIKRGFLGVIAVEHDYANTLVPRITKGTDGRSLI